MAPDCRVIDVAAEKTVNWWGREKLHLQAAVIAPCEAGFAGVADDIWLNGDSVADFEVRHGRVRGKNYSRRFMAKNVGIFYYHGANAAGVPEVDIRAGELSILAWDYPWFKVDLRGADDGPANSSAFDGDCDLSVTQGLPLLDILEARLGLCDPEMVGWVRVDANIGFEYGGSSSSGHDDDDEWEGVLETV